MNLRNDVSIAFPFCLPIAIGTVSKWLRNKQKVEGKRCAAVDRLLLERSLGKRYRCAEICYAKYTSLRSVRYWIHGNNPAFGFSYVTYRYTLILDGSPNR